MSGRNPIFQSKVTDFSQSQGSEQEASEIEVLSGSSDSDTEDLSLSPRQASKRSLSAEYTQQHFPHFCQFIWKERHLRPAQTKPYCGFG